MNKKKIKPIIIVAFIYILHSLLFPYSFLSIQLFNTNPVTQQEATMHIYYLKEAPESKEVKSYIDSQPTELALFWNGLITFLEDNPIFKNDNHITYYKMRKMDSDIKRILTISINIDANNDCIDDILQSLDRISLSTGNVSNLNNYFQNNGLHIFWIKDEIKYLSKKLYCLN